MAAPAPPSAPQQWWASVLPLVTFLAGFAAKAVEGWLQDKRTGMREGQARRDARRDFLLQRRAEFQRENLIELQEALNRLGRAAGKIIHHDEMEFGKSGEWGKSLTGEDVSEEYRLSVVEVTKRSSRIRDAEVRQNAGRVSGLCTAAISASTQAESRLNFKLAVEAQKALNNRIGAVLMNLEDETLAEAER